MSGPAIRALLLAALMLPLAGCWKDQRQALSACNASVPYRSKHSPWAHIETPMTHCMEARGYRIAYDNRYCLGTPLPRRSPYCYVPQGWLAGIGFQLEMLYQPSPAPPSVGRANVKN